MKVSLILTVKNEIDNIDVFFDSLIKQSLKPDEIIIVDAGSNDGTYEKLLSYTNVFSNLCIISSPGCNRSQGRNIAIKKAKYDIIAATDFGCLLHKDWIEEIIKPIVDGNADVTAGFYLNTDKRIIALSNSFFTHPDLFEIDENNFLPSTRSIAFKKICWDSVGGFDEKFILGEDTKFDFELKKMNFNFSFNKNAIVYWDAENSILKMIKKLFNYSMWDGVGKFNSFYYIKKSIILFFLILFLIMIFIDIRFLFIFVLFFLFFVSKIIIRIKKKKMKMSSGFVVLILKPLYDFVQSIGYYFGRIIGRKI